MIGKKVLVSICIMLMILAAPTAGQDSNFPGEPTGFALEVYTDLAVGRHTQVAITLEPIPSRLSDTVQGGEDIMLKIYSDDALVGQINNRAVSYAVDFIPQDTYVEISGKPGTEFDVTFSFHPAG